MSEITICNQALSEMSAQATIVSFTETSKEAVTAALWYTPLRKKLLRAAHWGFARRQLSLTEAGNLVAGTAPYPWAYKYVYPADCIRVRYLIWPPWPVSSDADVVGDQVGAPYYAGPSRNNRFLVHNEGSTKYLLSNVPNAICVYTANVTDTDLFDDLFEQALMQALAAKFSGAITGNMQMKKDYEALAEATIVVARAADGQEALPTTDHTPDWIAVRGVPAYGFTPASVGFGAGDWYNGYENLGWGM